MAGDTVSLNLVKAGFTLWLDLLSKATTCTARYAPANNGACLTEEDLRGFLASHSIKENINEAGIQELVRAAAQKKSVDSIILAQGNAMQPGADGGLRLMAPDALGKDNDCDENGNPVDCKTIDFRKVQTFCNVEPNDCIGIIYPPGAGVAGKTVRSELIPPEPGKPVQIRFGKGIYLGDDGCTLYANLAGRVHNSSDEGVTVEQIYTVKGNVDFRTGNIKFNGHVEITGDVLDGFEVNASKGIKILGIVGNAKIISDGNIDICGMAGSGVGSIHCGGDLVLKYCNDSSILCAGNITVHTEMRNCKVCCLGTLLVKNGSFCGGECIVLAGMAAVVIGTRAALPTSVIVGVDYRDYNEVERINHLLIQLNAQFMASPPNQQALANFMAERNKLSTLLQEISLRHNDTANAKVNVLRIIHENVRFKLGRAPYISNEEIAGPVTLISDHDEKTVLQLQMSELPITAGQLKEELTLEKKQQKEV